ncbi:MAG: 23S rRNA (adenine(2503)-C(2))-methyltransferase RlmN [Planctomycetota bacterium]
MNPLPSSVSALSSNELAALFKTLGEPAFRATQLLEFFYRKGVSSYDEVTNLSLALREKLKLVAPLYALSLVARSAGDETVKWLWRAADGAQFESVQIEAPDRMTSCLSSQVGCAMGCVFCATGLSGFERHLRAHEILEQYLQMRSQSGTHSSHVVFMGMGEPLHNYDEVLVAARKLNAPPPQGAGIGARRITISTVGIVPGIRRLADENLQLELAISLHAPDEEIRRKLIPTANCYSIREILAAAEEYFKRTHRLVTYEYTLLAEVNDSPEQARCLARLLQTHPCKVNLIPFNPVSEIGFKQSELNAQERFKRILDEARIPTTIRFSKGRQVDAACGQLRRRVLAADGVSSTQ